MPAAYEPELLDEARSMYESGMSFHEVADHLNCDPESLRRALIRRRGLTPRPKGGGGSSHNETAVPDWVGPAYASGDSLESIAAAAGVSRSAAKRWVVASGVSIRPRNGSWDLTPEEELKARRVERQRRYRARKRLEHES